jgi:pyruvate dehydrogenase complex dehydrogenase (E1) component
MSDEGYWAIALVLGLVVAVVAVVLLEIFLRQVHRVERGAGAVWTAGKQVARNTATTWLLPETSGRLDLLTDEAMKHVDLLTPPPAKASKASKKVAR